MTRVATARQIRTPQALRATRWRRARSRSGASRQTWQRHVSTPPPCGRLPSLRLAARHGLETRAPACEHWMSPPQWRAPLSCEGLAQLSALRRARRRGCLLDSQGGECVVPRATPRPPRTNASPRPQLLLVAASLRHDSLREAPLHAASRPARPRRAWRGRASCDRMRGDTRRWRAGRTG